jgi:HNH endonuclease
VPDSFSAGYKGWTLYTETTSSKRMYLHRLIASIFIPNPANKKTINHKNGIKTDNRVVNLEWTTSSENNLHAYRVLKKQSSTSAGRSASLAIQKEMWKNCTLEERRLKTQHLRAPEVRKKQSETLKKTWANTPKEEKYKHLKSWFAAGVVASIKAVSRPVIQLKDDKIINEYNSIAQAIRITKSSKIIDCLKGRRKCCAHGFKWVYKKDMQ